MIRFAVVTRVPDPEDGGDAGNMAWAMPYLVTDQHGLTVRAAVRYPGLEGYVAAWRAPVFTLGEVLIVGDDGREVVAPSRKPSKWDVDVETFDTVLAAIARAQEVIR